MVLIGWRLWYTNSSTFSSADGTWDQAPSQGVQVLCLYYDNGQREVVAGRDYYTRPTLGLNARKYGALIGVYDPTPGSVTAGEGQTIAMQNQAQHSRVP